MFQKLVVLYFLFGVIAVTYVAPAMYSLGVLKIGTDNMLDTSDKVKCFIPFVNLFYSKSFYSNSMSWTGIGYLLVTFSLVLRIVGIFILPDKVKIYTLLILYVMALLAYILTMVDILTVLYKVDSAILPFAFKLFLIVAAPVGMLYIGVFLYNKVRKHEKSKSRASTLITG